MAKSNTLRSRYIRRTIIGAVLLAILAVPAAIHSRAAIHTLLNRPIDWVPDSLPEKAAFNELCSRFVVSDAILVTWPGATIDSEGLRHVTETLDTLCSHLGESQDDRRELAEDEGWEEPQHALEIVKEMRDICGVQHPFLNVKSGASVVDQMTSSPSSLSRRSAIARLKGFLIGPDGEQSCVVLTLGESAHAFRRDLFPLVRELIEEVTGTEQDKIAMVGGPRDGADGIRPASEA